MDKLLNIILFIFCFLSFVNCISLINNNIIGYDTSSSGGNSSGIGSSSSDDSSWIYFFSTQPHTGDSFVFVLNECVPSFYNIYILTDYSNNGNGEQTIVIKLFNNQQCMGSPVFSKKLQGSAPFENVYIPFMPQGFDSTDKQLFTIDVKQPSPFPLGSVILSLDLGQNCNNGVYGYALYYNGTVITADLQVSTLQCINDVPWTQTCNSAGDCDPALFLDECLHFEGFNDFTAYGWCSSTSEYLPFK